MKIYAYKTLQLVLTLSIIFSTAVSASSINPLPDNIERPNHELALYSQEISGGAWDYANEFFDFFLYSAVLVGSITVGNETSLGTPFTIQNSEISVYYFPIVSDGIIVGTFRIFVDEIRTNENNQTTYSGILSPYLAEELNTLIGVHSVGVLLYYDNGNLMVQVEDEIELLAPCPGGELPELNEYEIPVDEFYLIIPLETSISIESLELTIITL